MIRSGSLQLGHACLQPGDAFLTGQLLPGQLQPQRRAVIGNPHPAQQLPRWVGAGEARTFAAEVLGVTSLRIARDSGIDATVGAFDQIDSPGGSTGRIAHALTPTRPGLRQRTPASTTGAP